MPICEEHGGGCCGITHVYDFGYYTEDAGRSLDNLIQSIFDGWELDKKGKANEENYYRPSTHLIEVVLTDGQLTVGGWAQPLKARGFRLVTRFLNANSGNYCNVFHLCDRTPIRPVSRLPFNWGRRR